MEDNVLDDGIARTAAQCLQSFAAIRTKDFDYRASLGRWGNQSTVRIDTERSEFSLMSLYHTIHTVFSHYINQPKQKPINNQKKWSKDSSYLP